MSKFFTVITTVDNHGAKSFYSANGKTEQKSIDKAFDNIGIHLKGIDIGNDDEILAIRTYDDIGAVSLKQIRQ